MNTPIGHVSARCDDCNKTYRVPDFDRTYECRACGGTVRIDTDSLPPETNGNGNPVPTIDGTVTCTECNAILPGGTQYCVECGTSLDESEPVEGSHAAARLRQQASYALKEAYFWVEGTALAFRLGALAYAIATMFAIMALARTDVPQEAGVLVVGLTTLLSVLLLMAALHIQFKPFAWTVAIAMLATGVSVVHLLGPNPLGVAFPGSAAWAVLAWASLVPNFRFKKLIARHKDLYILHHASARTRRALKGRTAHERHERLLRAMRRASRRTWKLSATAAGAISLLSVLGTFAVLSSARPQELTPLLERFENAWNDANRAELDDLFEPRIRDVESARLAGLLHGYDWETTPPTLDEGRAREEGDRTLVDYEVDDIKIETSWTRVGPRWFLLRVDLPLPSLEPMLAVFREAWSASDPKAIAALFAEDARAEMIERIETAARGRGWESFPRIQSTSLEVEERGRVTATFILAKDKLRAEWYFRTEGEWCLNGLRFPKR